MAAQKLSPVDVLEAYLRRTEARNPKLQAFVEVYAADARIAAQGAEQAIRSGHAVGPLHGIPIALKDLIEIKGKTVTGGSEVWRERKAQRTATLARRLIAQGMIVLGKTHTVEFAAFSTERSDTSVDAYLCSVSGIRPRRRPRTPRFMPGIPPGARAGRDAGGNMVVELS